jgi:hypothetical protein
MSTGVHRLGCHLAVSRTRLGWGWTPMETRIGEARPDFGDVHWAFDRYEPNQVNRDTRVDIAKA